MSNPSIFRVAPGARPICTRTLWTELAKERLRVAATALSDILDETRDPDCCSAINEIQRLAENALDALEGASDEAE